MTSSPSAAGVARTPAAGGSSLERLTAALESTVLGQRHVVADLVTAFLARGHVLLEGVPGVAKTLTARSMASALGLDFSRVQFTPDLMPSDILGTNVFRPQDNAFQLVKGPVFTEVLVADEINRTPPKTQAALLEAMEERQVTIDGTTHALPAHFFVVATQNPLELEGTYPLPEAQLDRFLMRVRVGYPPPEAELDMVRGFHQREGKVAQVARVLDARHARGAAGPGGTRRLRRVHPLLRGEAHPRDARQPARAPGGLAALGAGAAGRGQVPSGPQRLGLRHPGRREGRLPQRPQPSPDSEGRGGGGGPHRGRRAPPDVGARPGSPVSLGRPVPTGLAVALVAAALVPAAMAVAGSAFLWLALALDAAVLLLCAFDFLSAPRASDLEVRRVLEPVLSSGVANPVRLELHLLGQRPVRGRVRDEVPPGVDVHGHEQPFSLSPRGSPRHRLLRPHPAHAWRSAPR